MPLAEVQRVLARLYTDTALRAQFFADPERVGQEWGLNAEDRSLLTRLSAAQVAGFAASLHQKRWNEVVKLLPLSAQIGGRRLFQDFLRFADTSVPLGVGKHREDALAFAEALLRAETDKEFVPDWAKDLLRYEEALLMAAEPGRLWLARRFRYPVDRLATALRQKDAITSTPQPTLLLWVRFVRQGRVSLRVMRLPHIQDFHIPGKKKPTSIGR